jgi:hypothetical protein
MNPLGNVRRSLWMCKAYFGNHYSRICCNVFAKLPVYEEFSNIKFLPTSLQNVYLHVYQKTTDDSMHVYQKTIDDSIRRYFLNQLHLHKICIYLSREYRPAIIRHAISIIQ